MPGTVFIAMREDIAAALKRPNAIVAEVVADATARNVGAMDAKTSNAFEFAKLVNALRSALKASVTPFAMSFIPCNTADAPLPFPSSRLSAIELNVDASSSCSGENACIAHSLIFI